MPKPRWSRRAVVTDLHLHRQRKPSSVINYIYLSRAYLNMTDCTHIYRPIPMALGRAHASNDIPRDFPGAAVAALAATLFSPILIRRGYWSGRK